MPRQERPLLVLLDMNGTILRRAKSDLIGGRKPDLLHNSIRYYMRPHAITLVDLLRSHPRARLGFYTSMRRENALPAVTWLLGKSAKDSTGEASRILYHRGFNKRDPLGSNHWDTMRDIPKVWRTPKMIGSGFNASNTIMVDDTPRKMREMPGNVIVLPEFTEVAVVNGNDNVIPQVCSYLQTLLEDSSWTDVRRRERFTLELEKQGVISK
ncbi:unnamed protein product [Chrysoparadoxa australica]